MKFGVVFPQTEIGADPLVIRDYAQAVEEMGFSYLLVYDHVVGANPNRPGGWQGPYTHREMFHEPFVLFGYLAGLTKTLELVTGILISPQRQTVLIAKQAAQVDVLTGGRLRLGIGVGWNPVEYEALNENFSDRGKRSEEQVHVLRALWTNELVTLKTEHHTISDAGLNPMPIQRPIPIWFGGLADSVLDRAARLGDGWLPPSSGTLEEGAVIMDKLKTHLDKYNRDISTFGVDIRVSIKTQPREAWIPYVEGWRAMGATHAGFNTMGAGYKTLDEHLNAIRQFKAEMGF